MVRKRILQQYYETVYGKTELVHEVGPYFTNDFEEYYSLLKIAFPDMQRRRAAEMNEKFSKFAEGFPPYTKERHQEPCRQLHVGKKILAFEYEKRGIYVHIDPQKQIDLKSVAFPANTRILVVDKCKSVLNLAVLTDLKKLNTLSFITSAAPDEEINKGGKLCELQELVFMENYFSLTKQILSMVSSVAELSITDYLRPFDCNLLRNLNNIEKLIIRVPRIKNLQVLKQSALREINFQKIDFSNSVTDFLQLHKGTLTEISLEVTTPVSPKQLIPSVPPKLKRLLLPAFPDYKEEWINWAVRYPHVACSFENLSCLEERSPYKIGEVYRDISIFSGKDNRQIFFEISENIVDLFGVNKIDNGDLENIVKKYFKNEKSINYWSSEADMFVVRTSTMKSVIEIIDRIYQTIQK